MTKFRFSAGCGLFARDVNSFAQIAEALRRIDAKEYGYVVLKAGGKRELSVWRHDTGFDVERFDHASNSYWYAAKPQFKRQEFSLESTDSRDGDLRYVVFSREEVEAIFSTFYHERSHFPIAFRWHSRPMEEAVSLSIMIRLLAVALLELAGVTLLLASPFILVAALVARAF